MRRALGIASAFLALTAGPASAATLTSNGALIPPFSRGLSNFTTTCSGGSMRLGISVLRSTSVKVGTAAALKGPRTATVKLQPGRRVIVQVTEGGRASSHSIRCVPSDFPRSSATGMLPADIPMLAINDISSRTRSKTSNTSYAIIVDRHGVPIWWHKENLSLVNFFATPDGSLAIGHASGPLKLLSPRGNVTGSVKPVNGDVDGHDASPTGAGRWLMALHTTRSKVDLRPIGLAASGKTIDSSILEVDAHGKTLWSWSSAQHFATSESILTQVTKSTAGSIADLAHVNSFEEDGQGGIIASFRNTSAVYRIIKATGEIDWKLGGSTTPKSLTVLGDPGISATFHLLGQHDARLQDDGTLTLFDNGSTVVQGGQRYSRQARALRIRIDPIARTATFVEAVTDPTIGSSPACGSAWRTADGHWLVAWGAKPSVRAYDSGGKPYFSLSYLDPQRFTYRAAPIESPSLTEAAVVSGMDYVR